MSGTGNIENSPLCVQAQLWLVDYLKTRERFAGVTVLGRREKNIVSDIDGAIAELGVCIYWLPARLVKANRNLPGPAGEFEIRGRCIEDPTLNTTLPDAYELAEALLRDCTGLALRGVEGLQALWPADVPTEEQPDDSRIIIDAIFRVNGAYQPRIEDR